MQFEMSDADMTGQTPMTSEAPEVASEPAVAPMTSEEQPQPVPEQPLTQAEPQPFLAVPGPDGTPYRQFTTPEAAIESIRHQDEYIRQLRETLDVVTRRQAAPPTTPTQPQDQFEIQRAALKQRLAQIVDPQLVDGLADAFVESQRESVMAQQRAEQERQEALVNQRIEYNERRYDELKRTGALDPEFTPENPTAFGFIRMFPYETVEQVHQRFLNHKNGKAQPQAGAATAALQARTAQTTRMYAMPAGGSGSNPTQQADSPFVQRAVERFKSTVRKYTPEDLADIRRSAQQMEMGDRQPVATTHRGGYQFEMGD